VIVVEALDVIVYEDDGWTWRSHEVPSPSWEQIETAIRGLDKFRHPFLFLRRKKDVKGEEEFQILGGPGSYWFAVCTGGNQRRYFNPARGSEEIAVWTSDQGFADEARFICDDVEIVLKAARHYAETGDFDPTISWEEVM